MDIKSRGHRAPQTAEARTPAKATPAAQTAARKGPAPAERELSRAAMEALNPRLTGHIRGGASPGALWGGGRDIGRMEQQLEQLNSEMDEIAGQLARVAEQLEKTWDASSGKTRTEVIRELAEKENLDPKLRKSLMRYARKLDRLEARRADADTSSERAQVDKEIKKVTENAAKKVEKEGAKVDLLEVVEEKAADPEKASSLSNLLKSWFSCFTRYFNIFRELAQVPTEVDSSTKRQAKKAEQIKEELLQRLVKREAVRGTIVQQLVAAADRRAGS